MQLFKLEVGQNAGVSPLILLIRLSVSLTIIEMLGDWLLYECSHSVNKLKKISSPLEVPQVMLSLCIKLLWIIFSCITPDRQK